MRSLPAEAGSPSTTPAAGPPPEWARDETAPPVGGEPAGGRPGQTAPGTPRPAFRLLFLLVLLTCAYFIPRGVQANADSHLALTFSLVEHATARVDAFAPYLIDKAAYCGPVPGPCHHYYTDKAPGLSLLITPVYLALRPVLPASMVPKDPSVDRFLLRYLLTILTVGLCGAIFAASFWRFASRFASAGWALAVGAAYALGSIALPFSSLAFTHAVSAALLFWAFMLLYRRRTEQGPGLAVAAGALAGFAVACEYPTVLIALLLGAYALFSATRPLEGLKAGTLVALGGALGFAPALVYNLAVYGGPISQGYAHLTNSYYAAGMAHGILGVGLPTWSAAWGTTFSPYRGLFILSPWLLLAIPGFRRLWQSGLRAETGLCLAVVAVYFIFQCGYAFWDGGASVGPRHFLPALPFLAFPVLFAGERPLLRRLGMALIVWSSAVMLLVMATNPLFADPYYVKSVSNPLIDQTLHDVARGAWQNNWGMVFGLRGPSALLPLGLAAAWILRGMCRSLSATTNTPGTGA